jgi:hypothetical protein
VELESELKKNILSTEDSLRLVAENLQLQAQPIAGSSYPLENFESRMYFHLNK